MQKRHAIIEAAASLYGSIDAATMLEIAEAADVTEPLIYHPLKSRNELFTYIFYLAFDQYFACLLELPKQTATEFQKYIELIGLCLPNIKNTRESAIPGMSE